MVNKYKWENPRGDKYQGNVPKNVRRGTSNHGNG